KMISLAMSAMGGGGGGGADTGEGAGIVVSEAGEVIERTLEMTQGSMIRGIVQTPAGEPVSGAQVAVEFASNQRGFMQQIAEFFPLGDARLTGSDGTFAVPGPPPGQKVVIVAKSRGYLDGKSESVEVTAGEDVEGLTVSLRSGAMLTGRVKGPDGHPLEGATVRHVPKGDGNDWSLRWRLGRATPTMTDAEGVFKVTNVETGALIVQFAHPKFLSSSRNDVTAEEGGSVDLDAQLEAGKTLEGKVVGPDGQPFPGARIDINRQGDLPSGADPYYQAPDDLSTAADGTFSVEGVMPGSYRLMATADGAADSEPVTVDAGGQPVTLQLATAYSISGKVVSRDGQPVGNARVTAMLKKGDVEEQVQSTNTNREGAFILEDVPGGTYTVKAAAGWGMGRSRANLMPKTVENVQAGASDLVIEVEAGLTMKGKVIGPDGEPMAEGWLNARQEKPEEGQEAVTSNGALLNGEFELTGLAPGKYRVTVYGNGTSSKSVVAEAGDEDVVVDYRSGGAIEGRVLLPDGMPAANVWVSANGPGGQGGGRTSDDGSFSLTGLEPGKYTVSSFWNNEGTMHNGSMTELDVTEGGTLRGIEINLAEMTTDGR
ncbi:MAG: carboxypeptidase regulatory-like domain-containing protein, partial [Planctomycetota bacterium]